MPTKIYDTGYELSSTRRDLYFKIIEDIQLTEWIAPKLYFLDDGFPPPKVEKALRWLIQNKLTGSKFLEWFNAVCQGSNLQMHAELLRRCDNEKVERIIAGKNFKV